MKCGFVTQDNYMSAGKLWKSNLIVSVVICDCDTGTIQVSF